MKGICFKEPLFYATVRGSKTQTRRIMKPQPDDNQIWNSILGLEVKPRYKKGELLYLKEPYLDDLSIEKTFYKYRKSDVDELMKEYPEMDSAGRGFWRNKLFMPESAARYFIKITDVRVERLKDITEEDCIKEGIEWHKREPVKSWFAPLLNWFSGTDYFETPIEAYAALIDQINGKGTWESNPFVFVYDYELMPF